MTLYEITQAIERVMRAQPVCGDIIRNDVFRINERASVTYPVMAWEQRSHTLEGDFTRFAFTLYYAERLTEDKANEVSAQSAGHSTLVNILAGLRDLDGLSIGSATFNVFIQRFKDLTAGCSCQFSVLVPNNTSCYDEY